VKYCVCEAGVFIECRCPRPEWYKGAPDAPYCDKYTEDGKGLTASFVDPITDDPVPCVRDGVADAVEWDQCVARDPVDGFTPRGCVCMDERTPFGQPSNPANLVWICASTEKWFYPEQSTIP
jgi:hypothetical protein